jgi:hypothetical protein
MVAAVSNSYLPTLLWMLLPAYCAINPATHCLPTVPSTTLTLSDYIIILAGPQILCHKQSPRSYTKQLQILQTCIFSTSLQTQKYYKTQVCRLASSCS